MAEPGSSASRSRIEDSQGNGDEVDDDAKIALLASLLEPATFPMNEYVDALRDARGDVQTAAEAMLLPGIKRAGKRKAGTSLESWLGNKRGGKAGPVGHANESPRIGDRPVRREVSDVGHPVQKSPFKSLASDQQSPSKPPADAFSVLLRTPAPTIPAKVKAAPQPPVHLAFQTQIDAHELPLTLLRSPLSASFASALYLAMMQESEKWERNRWYLAGRWVESPHTMTSYSRGEGYGDPDFRETDSQVVKYFYSGSEQRKNAVSSP
jgi:hypothetical protein